MRLVMRVVALSVFARAVLLAGVGWLRRQYQAARGLGRGSGAWSLSALAALPPVGFMAAGLRPASLWLLFAVTAGLAVSALFVVGARMARSETLWRHRVEALERAMAAQEEHARRLRADNARLQQQMEVRAGELQQRGLRLEAETDGRARAEALLADERERLRVTLDSIADAVVTVDGLQRVLLMNRAAQGLTGWTQEEAVGRPVDEILPLAPYPGRGDAVPVAQVVQTGRATGMPQDVTLLTRAGERLEISVQATPLRDPERRATGAVAVFRGISDRKRRADELVRAQKLESVSTLASGIAHDFNNILTAILGNLILAKINIARDDKTYVLLQDAEIACGRARELTQQLLTFARGGAPLKRRLPLAPLVCASARIVLADSPIQLSCASAAEDAGDALEVLADPGQMDQVIQTVVRNAREAMPDGGTLVIGMGIHVLDEASVVPLPPGRYVRVQVQDSGRGMETTTLSRIFDPYFTTKPDGSGLGLATAYAIMREHDGHIQVQPGPGRGTLVTLYLPLAAADGTGTPSVTRGAGARILLVDDDPDVRSVGRRLLDTLGYVVVEAPDCETGISLFEQTRTDPTQRFAAVILDLTIPGGLGAVDCIRLLRRLDPTVRALVSSGYSNNPVLSEYRHWGFVGAVVKPYRLDELARAVATALET